ncbi:DUF4142 domain-containing protein [Massilia horti]|uniref:DUF4142 domain-containing protein n=1 Tax=Massilia horti TaxID=2562153 RepID=UPI00143143EC|nr:DUF4142 domain-containing protein [Massilia horti]
MAHVNPVQIQKFLKGMDYPASKASLIDKAKSEGADANVCASLEMLPDEMFQTPADVSQAFGRLPDDVTGGRDEGQEHKRDTRHEAKPKEAEAKHETKHEAKHETKHEAKPKEAEAKHETKHEAKPKEQAEEKHETKHEAKHETRHEAKPHLGSNEFLIEALQDSMAEVKICEMAMEKSQNPEVKHFAQRMIDEHGRMSRDMEKLATDKKLEVPRAIRREQQMTVDELSGVEGTVFEQRWIQYEIDVHERDIKVFSHYADTEPDPEIKKMAKEGARMFGDHLKRAHDVGKKLGRA